jgi:hypothetical protein
LRVSFFFKVLHYEREKRAWERPTLPRPCGRSTIGPGGEPGPVRNGKAGFTPGIAPKLQEKLDIEK